MMLYKNRKQSVVNIAALPGCAVAVQLQSEHFDAKPRLAKALVQESRASATEKLDTFAKPFGVRRKKVRLLCESADYQLLQAELPAVPAEELNAAIAWQLKDQLRTPVAQTTLRVAAPPDNSPGIRRPLAFVAAADNAFLSQRIQQFRPFNAHISAIGIPEFAQRNIADLIEESNHATAILSLTPNGCLLTVSRDSTLYLVRSFDISTQNLATSEAERRDQFDRLLLELQRSIDMLEHQFSFLSLSTLWLAPFAYRDELLSLLIDALYLPVKTLELDQVFDCSQYDLPSNLDHQAALFLVLGLALEEQAPEAGRINLFNSALLPVQPFFQFSTMLLSLLAVMLVLLAIGLLLQRGVAGLEAQAQQAQKRTQERQQAVTQLEQNMATRQLNPRIASEVASLQAEHAQLKQVAASLQSGQMNGQSAFTFADVLGDLARVQSNGVWLNQIGMQDGRISLQGLAVNAAEIPEYLSALRQLPTFKGQRFSLFDLARAEGEMNTQVAPLAFRLDAFKEGGQP